METPKLRITIETEVGEVLIVLEVYDYMAGRFLKWLGEQLGGIVPIGMVKSPPPPGGETAAGKEVPL